MTMRRRQPVAAAAALVLSTLAAGVLAACESDEASVATGAEAEVGEAMSTTVPAEIDPRPHGYVSTDVMRPLENAWRTASAEQFTEVNAGALASDPSTGALAIFRNDYLTVTQNVELVRVKGSGPLKITKAPTGPGVVESAQEDGEIEFTGARGVRGTLSLSDDTVAIAGH